MKVGMRGGRSFRIARTMCVIAAGVIVAAGFGAGVARATEDKDPEQDGPVASTAIVEEAATFPSGRKITLTATVFRPETGAGPFPAVVALHGCSGLRTPEGDIKSRHLQWGRHLARHGFVVVMPESFAARGLGSQCAIERRRVRSRRERVRDANAAKAWLAARADVKPGAISVLGWSNGAATALHAMTPGRASKDGVPDFAAAVAFYPGCRKLLDRRVWRPRRPTLVLIGAADEWTPAPPCVALGRLAAQRGDPLTVVSYPDAHHDFDYPDLPLRELDNLATAPTGRARVGTHPAARDDALARVPAFLPR